MKSQHAFALQQSLLRVGRLRRKPRFEAGLKRLLGNLALPNL